MKKWKIIIFLIGFIFVLNTITYAVWWNDNYNTKMQANFTVTTTLSSNRTINISFLLQLNSSNAPNSSVNWSDLRIVDASETYATPFQFLSVNTSGQTYIVVNSNTSNITLYWNTTSKSYGNTSSPFPNPVLGYWEMESQTNDSDLSSQINNAFNVSDNIGITVREDCLFSRCLTYSGFTDTNNGNVTKINNIKSYNIDNFTVTLWVYVNFTSGGNPRRMIISKTDVSGADDIIAGWSLAVDGTGTVFFEPSNLGTAKLKINQSSWQFLAFGINQSHMFIYNSTNVNFTPLTSSYIDTANPIYIGCHQRAIGYCRVHPAFDAFIGSVDEVIFWNGTLYADNIRYIYESQNNTVSFSSTITLPPANLTYTSLQNNASSFTVYNGNVSFGVNANDSYGLDSSTFLANDTGSFLTKTVTTIGGNPKNSTINVTFLVQATRGKNVCGYFNLSDTSGKINQTVNSCFTVNNTVPTVNLSFNVTSVEPFDILGIRLNYSDIDSDSWTANDTRWFKNGSLIASAINSTSLNFNNFTYGDVINFSAKVYDGFNWSNLTLYQPNISITIQDTGTSTFTGNESNQTSVTVDTSLTIYINLSDTGSNISSATAEFQDANSRNNQSMTNTSRNTQGNDNPRFSASFTPTLTPWVAVKFFVTDFAGNTNTTPDRYYNITVNAAGGNGGGGGGGGGGYAGCDAGFANVNGTCVPVGNLTKAERCGDSFCDALLGEDPFNCLKDCPFQAASFTCSDPTKPCLFNNTSFVATIVIGIFVLGVVFLQLQIRSVADAKDKFHQLKSKVFKRNFFNRKF